MKFNFTLSLRRDTLMKRVNLHEWAGVLLALAGFITFFFTDDSTEAAFTGVILMSFGFGYGIRQLEEW